ncbi:MAG: citrate synthase [Pseudomonadota bacterium]
MNKKTPKVQLRDVQFAKKTSTRIWKEVPSAENPYIASRCLAHGYDLLELMQQRGYTDIIFLLFRDKLPTRDQRDLMEALMVGLCNPGPRHPATRAAMNAGIGKTDTAHILPIALSILGGLHLGGTEVQTSMRFIRTHFKKDSRRVVEELIKNINSDTNPVDQHKHITPGFGQRFGSLEIIPEKIANVLSEMKGSGRALRWSMDFVENLKKHDHGWLTPGVAAATFIDLGFHPRAGAGLFQMLCTPGLLAHGLELTNKPITATPFIDEEHYFIDEAE